MNPQSAGSDPVVVVGGGMAGLSAARVLHQRGVDVVVLEGADRVGGRLHTVDLAGSSVDLGAAWIHGPIGNPLTPLAEESGVVGYQTTFSETPAGLVAADAEGASLSSESFAAGVRSFWKQSDAEFVASKQSDDVHPDRTFAQVLSEGPIEAEASLDAAGVAGFEFASWVGLQGHEATDLDQLSFDGYDYETRPGGDLLLADGGYEKLVDLAASDLPDIRLRTVVKSITKTATGHQVEFETANGVVDRINAAAVIVTASIGVLQAGAIRFAPPLPESSTNAINSIGMGANEKLAIAFEERPWGPDDGYAVVTGSDPGDPYVSWLLRSDAPIAVSYAGGSRARAMGAQSDDEALALGLQRLTDLFGPLPMVSDFARTNWVDDPLTLGSYSFNTAKASNDARALLSKPVRQGLVLAGEAMNATDYGTAHGALLAGERAAGQIIETLKDTAR